MSGLVEAVCLSPERGPKRSAERGRLLVDRGFEGDAHATGGPRQVSLLAADAIEELRRLGLDLLPGAFGENLIIQGLDLTGLRPGDRLRLSGGARLEVTKIGKECPAPCAIFRAVGRCIMPEQGVFARVLVGGEVAAGDRVEQEGA